MARIRSLKPEAFTSETLAKVSVEAERTFFGLSTLADDRGRFRDQPAALNGALWPERRTHTPEDLEAELAAMEGVELICRYVGCDGKRYAHFVTWDRHQKVDKPSRTRLPRCPWHPVGSEGRDEECGRHDKDPCPASPSPREPSRALARIRDPGSSSQEDDNATLVGADSGTVANALADSGSPREPSPSGRDLGVHETLASPREDSRALDVGPRTVDLGPRTIKTPASPQADADEEDTSTAGELLHLVAVARPVPDPPDLFDEFWAAYPRKKDKGHARAAWARALKRGADPLKIIAAAQAYRADPERVRSGDRYTAFAATWLNGERYGDEDDANPRAAASNGHVPFRNPTDPHAYTEDL